MMSTTQIRFGTACFGTAGIAAVAFSLILTGCSDTPKNTSASTSAAAPAGPASAAPSGSGASAASVDGKALAAKFDTTCAQQGGVLALALTDLANATYGNLSVSASVTGTTVQAVGIAGSKGGSSGLPYALGYGKGAPGGSAALAKSGNTFHLTGEGVGMPDPTNPTGGVKTAKFDITFACSTVVGG
jgi:lipoprotein LpqH